MSYLIIVQIALSFILILLAYRFLGLSAAIGGIVGATIYFLSAY